MMQVSRQPSITHTFQYPRELTRTLSQASSALRQRRAELDAYRKSIFDAVTAGRAAPSEASSAEMGPPPAPAGFRAVYEPGLQYGRQVVDGMAMPLGGQSGRATPPAGFGDHLPAGLGEHPPAGFGEHPPSGFDAARSWCLYRRGAGCHRRGRVSPAVQPAPGRAQPAPEAARVAPGEEEPAEPAVAHHVRAQPGPHAVSAEDPGAVAELPPPSLARRAAWRRTGRP